MVKLQIWSSVHQPLTFVLESSLYFKMFIFSIWMENAHIKTGIHETKVILMMWSLWRGMNSACHVRILDFLETILKVQWPKWNILDYKEDSETKCKGWGPTVYFNLNFNSSISWPINKPSSCGLSYLSLNSSFIFISIQKCLHIWHSAENF